MNSLKSLLAIVLAAMTILVSASCSKSVEPTEEQVGEEAAVVVYTSIYPLYDFTAQIGGEKATVRGLIPAGSEPHDWEPTAGDIIALEQADLFIYNGAGLEHWVDTVLNAIGNEDLVVVEAAAVVPLLESSGGHSHDEEEHEHEDEDDDYDDGHNHGAADPHTWLSPVNAGLQSRAILEGLIQANPENEAYYTERYEQLEKRLEQLDKSYREALAPYAGNEVVVAHAAFGYLFHEYGLEQVAVQGFSPDSEPNPTQMAGIIEHAREHNISVIFFEEAASSAVAEVIAKEIGAETGVLDPMEQVSQARIDAGEDYISIMERNLDALLGALE